jgi:hypothetical protein
MSLKTALELMFRIGFGFTVCKLYVFYDVFKKIIKTTTHKVCISRARAYARFVVVISFISFLFYVFFDFLLESLMYQGLEGCFSCF